MRNHRLRLLRITSDRGCFTVWLHGKVVLWGGLPSPRLALT